MTPIEEVKTIHTSQGDNATRKWAFDLYDENGKIDSSEIKEQMIFDSRVGGTEQILPENGSDPTTSPIIADIQYPDSLRSEQTFLYRESPTTVNGQAKITSIKGNTVNFNQLVQNGNFADGTNLWFSTGSATISATNNKLTFTSPTTSEALARTQGFLFPKNHKGLAIIFSDDANVIRFRFYTSAWQTIFYEYMVREGNRQYLFFTSTDDASFVYVFPQNTNAVFDSIQVFDLTQMFGSGNEPTSIDQFTSLYPLPYYDYTTGKLLPFKGESLKTVGFNQWDEEWENGYYNINTGAKASNSNYIRCKNLIHVLPNTQYYFKTSVSDGGIVFYDGNGGYISGTYYSTYSSNIFTTPNGCGLLGFYQNGQTYNNDVCFNISNPSLNGKYEPYTSSTINLPTLTYFPTGMKSVPTAQDRLEEKKAVMKIKTTDMGELPWSYDSNGFFYTNSLNADMPKYSAYLLHPIQCGQYMVANFSTSLPDNQWGSVADKTIAYHCGSPTAGTYIYVKDTSFNGNATNFKNSLSGAELYYETNSPTETTIQTASLVTEKGEAPLYYDDELIADCNETISSESGIFDAKIKLMDDETIYSQKIQLHVERKP